MTADRPAIRLRRWAAVLVPIVLALVTGCSWPDDGPETTSPPPTIGSRAVDTTTPSTEPGPNPVEEGSDGQPTIAADIDPTVEPVALDEDAEVVEEVCGDLVTRCGMVLVPQVEGSPDLVAITFREWTDRREGTPLVVLDWGADEPLDGTDFPDRPVVVIGGRDDWSGGPGLACQEFGADIEPSVELVGDRAAGCRQVLEDGGFDIDGAGLRARVAEVGSAITALGHDSVSVVAAGPESDVVAGLAAVVDVDRVVYVNPSLADDAVAGATARTLADSYAEASAQCAESPRCEVSGSLDDLVAAVAELDANPLSDPWIDGESIDGSAVLDQLLLLDDASGFSDLPDFHRALVARDAEQVKAFLVSVPPEVADHQRIAACRLPAPPGQTLTTIEDLPEYLVDHVRDREARAAAFCQGIGVTSGPRPAALPGLVIETSPWNTSRQGHDAVGPVVVEPTVGWPSRGCITGAVSAYLADGSVDDAACRSGMRFATRKDTISLVETSVVDDWAEATVTLPVPETWRESWPGSWSRGADPSDVASLSVYLWEIADLDILLEDFAWDYGIVDWDRSTSAASGTTWEIARGETGEDWLIVASPDLDGEDVVIELWAESTEVDRLIAEVLEPVMSSVSVDASDIGE